MVTIADVMAKLTESGPDIENTVDVLLSGHPRTEVTGIAMTFMPSYNILSRAADLGLNLVIAHEAPFYQHRGKVDILDQDNVYRAKIGLIEKAQIAIFRFHDHMHRCDPDQIAMGLIRDLGWSDFVGKSKMNASFPLKTPPLTIPTMSVGEIARFIKKQMDIPFVRVVGDLTWPCSRVGILPGYCGGASLTIPFFQYEDLDLIITGEGPEWETPEYVRDAVSLNKHRALLILGHGKSEESGMRYLAESVSGWFPTVRVEFIKEEQPFELV